MSAVDKSISFYFFDLDDNTFFLETPVFVKNMRTGDVQSVSTHKFAEMRASLGNTEPWADYALYEDSYKNFRDRSESGEKEYLVEDIENAVTSVDQAWKGPAFDMFRYACEKQRPLAIVTARGHSRETIKAGIKVMVDHNFLPQEPNYLDIFAVSNAGMRKELEDSINCDKERSLVENSIDPTSPLKRIAIRNIVEKALKVYGEEPDHRFGMSDDDPMNVDLIIKAMSDCKNNYPDKRFFVINTHQGEHVKLEVFPINFAVTRKVDADEVVG